MAMDLQNQEPVKNEKEFSRRDLYGYFKECDKISHEKKMKFMENRLVKITNCPTEEISTFKRKLRYFKSEFKQKWAAAAKKEDRFLNKNEIWLAGSIRLPIWSKQKVGRPSKEFQESSDRSKRRKTKELREQAPEVLSYAAQMSLRAAGNSAASNIIKEMMTSPTRASKFRKTLAKKCNIQRLTPKQALSIFVNAGLSRTQYNIIREASPKLYPCYSLLQKAKQDCYPKREAFLVTETSAEVRLQDLLDHTISRICEYVGEVLEHQHITEEDREHLELISKWGCDGSQQQQFKQRFENDTDSDANIFQSSFVLIRLIVNNEGHIKTIWQNPIPSSPRFCRPIRIRFIHETNDLIKDEINYINNQVENLAATEIPLINGFLKVKHTLLLTMVDAKVCNAATNTLSTMRCYICKATSKDFNKLEKRSEENPDTFKFGLSVLHARIRLFVSILHLAYKLPLKKWQTRTEAEKDLVKETKLRIQESFKKDMALLVDVPKAGFGNTNDGNTSRRSFSDSETASRITGVDLQLIKNVQIILEVISSGHKIHVQKFASFCEETAQLYVDLYGWHPMTPTVHKILTRARPAIIEHAILPIGQLSEEAAEARNKHFRQYRQHYARKFSRISCNTDVLNRLLLTSDPVITCERTPSERTRKKTFSKEALSFFAEIIDPEYSFQQQENNESDISDNDESVITSEEDN